MREALASQENTCEEPLGLILRLRPLRESDVLVDMFTDRHGRLTALARGANRSQKRFTGLLLSGQLLKLQLSPVKNSELWLLNSARLVAGYVGLREDYRRWLAAGPVLEFLLRGTAPAQPLPECLYLALQSLSRLAASHSSQERRVALLIFINRFLHEIGFGLYLENCLTCQKPFNDKPLALSLQGGALCTLCAAAARQALTTPLGLVTSLKAGQKLSLDALGRLSFTHASVNLGLNFLTAFARRALSHDLSSLNFTEHI